MLFKKLWLNIKLFWYYLMSGMVSADKIIRSDQNTESLPIGGIEQQKEDQNVLKDLLKGVVTEEVKELRHEMYFSERASHRYSYGGGGHSKKNSMFDYTGNIERSDELNVMLVQENKQWVKGLEDEGISIAGNQINLCEKLQKDFKITRDPNEVYTLHVERDFYPRFKLEQYTKKIVVKEIPEDSEHVVVDLYISQYREQFNNISKLFQAEMDRIYQGDVRSELLEYNSLSFITKNCYGQDEMFFYEFDEPRFDNIIKFDGHYVLRFYCHVKVNALDLLMDKDIYNEKTAIKNEKHEMRKGATIDFDAAALEKAKAEFDVSDETELIENIKK